MVALHFGPVIGVARAIDRTKTDAAPFTRRSIACSPQRHQSLLGDPPQPDNAGVIHRFKQQCFPAGPVKENCSAILPCSTSQLITLSAIFPASTASPHISGASSSSCPVKMASPSLCRLPSGLLAIAVRPSPGNTPPPIQPSTPRRKSCRRTARASGMPGDGRNTGKGSQFRRQQRETPDHRKHRAPSGKVGTRLQRDRLNESCPNLDRGRKYVCIGVQDQQEKCPALSGHTSGHLQAVPPSPALPRPLSGIEADDKLGELRAKARICAAPGRAPAGNNSETADSTAAFPVQALRARD